jgi:hypothetical protein
LATPFVTAANSLGTSLQKHVQRFSQKGQRVNPVSVNREGKAVKNFSANLAGEIILCHNVRHSCGVFLPFTQIGDTACVSFTG